MENKDKLTSSVTPNAENYLSQDEIATINGRDIDKIKKLCTKKLGCIVEYLLDNRDLLDYYLDSKVHEDALSLIFQTKDYINIEFEQTIATRHPERFIHLVRVNEAFLDGTKRLDVYQKFELPEHLSDHVQVWKSLSDQLKKVNEKISQVVFKIDQESNSIWESYIRLSELIKIEFFDEESKEPIEYLAKVYEEYLNRFNIAGLSSKQDQQKNLFHGDIPINKLLDQYIYSLYKYLYKYVRYKSDMIDPYCYDKTVCIKKLQNSLYLYQSPKDRYNFRLDGLRYDFNWCRYQDYALLKSNSTSSIQHAFNTENKKASRSQFFDDLGLDENYINLFNAFQDFAGQYVRNEKKAAKASSVLYINKQELFSFFVDKNLKLKESFVRAILFGNANYVKDYHVLETPFLVVGDYVVCPKIFLLNPDYFYYSFKRRSHKQNLKQGDVFSKKCEKILTEEFNNYGFEAKIPSKDENNKIVGDVDVLVSERNEQVAIAIQFKRSSLRLTPKEANLEKIHSTAKAIDQLQKANIPEIKQVLGLNEDAKVIKWYVSTSPEGISDKLAPLLKINYFDILLTLRLLPSSCSLSEFIDVLESDKSLKELLHEINIMYDTEGKGYNVDRFSNSKQTLDFFISTKQLPVFNENPAAYIIPVDLNKSSIFDVPEIMPTFQHPLSMMNGSQIEALKKILETNKDNVCVLHFFASIYIEKSQWSDAAETLEEMLMIIPDEPNTLWRYAQVKKELGDESSYNNIMEQLQKDFWFVSYEDNHNE